MGLLTPPRSRPRTAAMILPPEAKPLLDSLAPLLHPAHLPPLHHAPGRRHPHHRPAHRRQPPPHPRRPRPRPPHHLPARPLPRRAGPASTRLRPHPLPARPASSPPGRSPWSATTPSTATPAARSTARPATATPSARPLLHRLAVRPQVGRPGRPGPLPVRHPAVGLARAGRPVPLARGRPGRGPPPPHPGPTDVPAAPPAARCGSPTGPSCSSGDAGYGTHEVARFCHRHRGRLTLVSKLHPDANLFDPPPPYAGQGPAPGQGATPCPSPAQAVAAARRTRPRRSAWYGGGTRQVETRDRHRALVQGRARAGPDPLGVRPRPRRHAPRRVLLHHRRRPVAGGRDRRLLRPLEHRDHLPGMPVATSGLETTRGLVPQHGAAGGPVPVRAVHRGRRPVPRRCPAASGRAGSRGRARRR